MGGITMRLGSDRSPRVSGWKRGSWGMLDLRNIGVGGWVLIPLGGQTGGADFAAITFQRGNLAAQAEGADAERRKVHGMTPAK
jgi:hypothetical protein